jgi:hypothetical protein
MNWLPTGYLNPLSNINYPIHTKAQGELIMKNLISLILILLITSSCTSNELYAPSDTDFKLTYTISNPTPKIGDEVVVTATLENLTNNDFTFNGDSPVSHISIVNLDDPNSMDIIVGTGLSIVFKSHQKLTENKKLKIEKPGKYTISATSRFVIRRTSNILETTFNLKTEPTSFDIIK